MGRFQCPNCGGPCRETKSDVLHAGRKIVKIECSDRDGCGLNGELSVRADE